MKKQTRLLMLSRLLLLGLIPLFARCTDSYFDFDKITGPELKPTFAIPLVKSRLTLDDVLPDHEIIHKDPTTGLVSLRFTVPRFVSPTARERMQIPNQVFNISTSFLSPPLPIGETFSHEFEVVRSFTTEKPGQRYDEITFSSGNVVLNIVSTMRNNAMIVLEIPNLIHRQTGRIYIDTIPMPFRGISPATFTLQKPVSAYRLRFQNISGNSSVTFNFTVYLEGGGGAAISNNEITASFGFQNLGFEMVRGYFGNYDFHFADSINIGFLGNIVERDISFAPAGIDFNIAVRNSYGLPIQVSVDPFFVRSPNRPPLNIHLFGSGVPNRFRVTAPDRPGLTATTNIVPTSNLAEAISTLPNFIVFNISALTNPDRNPLDTNFVLSSSQFEVDLTIGAELFGRIDELILRDTLQSEFEFIDDDADSLKLLLQITNTFPLEAAMQIFFVDAQFRVLDSLFATETKVIAGAPVGAGPGFRTTGPIKRATQIALPKSKIQNLARSRHLIIVTSLSTTEGNYAKIYSDYYIEVELATQASLNLNP